MLTPEEISIYTNEFNGLYLLDVFNNKDIVGDNEEEDIDFMKQMKEIRINDLFINKDIEITKIINNIIMNYKHINDKNEFLNIYNKIISNYKVIYYGKEIELYKLYHEFLRISNNLKIRQLESIVNKQTYLINKYENRFNKYSILLYDYDNRIKNIELNIKYFKYIFLMLFLHIYFNLILIFYKY
jgi:hypothetical protein